MGNLLGTGEGKTIATQAVRANGLQVQASSYGMGLSIVYGRARVPGTLIWYGDFQAVEHDQQVGKGGGGGTDVSFTYSSSFQLALCESDGTLTLGKIWKDSGLVSLSDINGTFGAGGASPAAWSHLSGAEALQYPYTSWIGCLNLKLGGSPNVPNFNFEINGLLQFNPGGGIYDAEPSAIITDLLTSFTHGLGFAYLGDLTNFGDYCKANSVFLSPVIDQETTMADVLTNLLQITNSNTAWSNGKLIVIPYSDQSASGNGATYTPPTTIQKYFTDKDYIGGGVRVDSKPLNDQPNVVRVEWIDPANNYVTSVAEAKDEADIAASIVRQTETIQAHAITNGTLAQQTAQQILQRALYIRRTFTFTSTLENVALEAGDVVALTDSEAELVEEPVRITQITEQDGDNLEFVCEEFPAGVAIGATQSIEAAAGFVPNVNGAPDTSQPPVIFRAPQFLVDGDVEVWIGICGSGANWGGANILASFDNVTYTKIGAVKPGCRYGTLTAALADSAADPDTTNSFSVALEGPGSLSGGTNAEADNLATLMLVDQELIAYSSTTLNGDGTYTLGNGYMRRQCYGTAHAAHAIGAPWIRVDDNIFRWKVDPSWVGTTVYLKFQAWNLYGGGLESEASLTPVTYVIGAAEEIPDTPPVPSSFGVHPAVNGNLLTWDNTNPAAVAITSIEYSTDNATWSVLGQVQGTHYAHPFSGNTNYYYRARARSPKFIWSSYTSSVSTMGGSIDYAPDGATYAKTKGAYVVNGQPFGIPFVSTGTVVAADSLILKSSSGSSAWDACAYSILGFTECHIVGKPNAASGLNRVMLGLSTNPKSSVSFTNANYAWYADSGTWQIYEAGTLVASYGAEASGDVAAIKYDGSTVTYLLNGVSQRTVAAAGLTLYGFVPIYDPGAGLNSVNFGPGSVIELTDTSQLNGNAATSPASSSYSTASTMNTSYQTWVAVTVTVPAGQSWPVLVTGHANAALGSAPTGNFRMQLDGSTVQAPLGWNSNMANLAFGIAFDYTTTLAAGTHTFSIQGINTSGGATFENATLTVNLLKR